MINSNLYCLVFKKLNEILWDILVDFGGVVFF